MAEKGFYNIRYKLTEDAGISVLFHDFCLGGGGAGYQFLATRRGTGCVGWQTVPAEQS